LLVFTQRLFVFTQKLFVFTQKLFAFTQKLNVFTQKLNVFTQKLLVFRMYSHRGTRWAASDPKKVEDRQKVENRCHGRRDMEWKAARCVTNRNRDCQVVYLHCLGCECQRGARLDALASVPDLLGILLLQELVVSG
jgi:hypothetical protein